ncbi:hypothetical protein CYMTET_6653 [Cymbomonas tetramitiformis]|uniref:Uncharacterized protein n=1 Tax=Cymbomonas tetramitiformis TaxID=36881 RepID=A0AAE0LHP0_9CHLO|nr:hypothetical protein CYMTET_6653 [Cymbomonas tetramitiformis]
MPRWDRGSAEQANGILRVDASAGFNNRRGGVGDASLARHGGKRRVDQCLQTGSSYRFQKEYRKQKRAQRGWRQSSLLFGNPQSNGANSQLELPDDAQEGVRVRMDCQAVAVQLPFCSVNWQHQKFPIAVVGRQPRRIAKRILGRSPPDGCYFSGPRKVQRKEVGAGFRA